MYMGKMKALKDRASLNQWGEKVNVVEKHDFLGNITNIQL